MRFLLWIWQRGEERKYGDLFSLAIRIAYRIFISDGFEPDGRIAFPQDAIVIFPSFRIPDRHLFGIVMGVGEDKQLVHEGTSFCHWKLRDEFSPLTAHFHQSPDFRMDPVHVQRVASEFLSHLHHCKKVLERGITPALVAGGQDESASLPRVADGPQALETDPVDTAL